MSRTSRSGWGWRAVAEGKQLVTFYLGDLLFGIDVRAVQEIIRRQRVTRVPLADPAVRGLMNLRGQIVTVIDLKERLGFPADHARDEETMNVVVRTEGGALSFQVDRIGDVLDVDAADFEPVPLSVKPAIRERALGIYKLKERFLHVIDVERVGQFRSRPASISTLGVTP